MGNISKQKQTKATTSWQSPSVYSIYTLLEHVTYMRPILKVTYAKSDLEKEILAFGHPEIRILSVYKPIRL